MSRPLVALASKPDSCNVHTAGSCAAVRLPMGFGERRHTCRLSNLLQCACCQVELVKGHDVVESYQSSGHVQRKYCGRCSSAVFAEVGLTA